MIGEVTAVRRILLGGSLVLARSIVRVLAVATATMLVSDLLCFGGPRSLVWVDPAPLPLAAGAVVVALFAILVLGWTWWPPPLRTVARLGVTAVALWCVLDAVRFWLALAQGRFTTDLPVPLSLVAAAALGMWAWWPPQVPPAAVSVWRLAVRLGFDGVVVLLLLAATVLAFGHTDYRRPADAIVVFGAGVRGDGRPSPTLAARTAKGIELWQQGLARHLVLTGGRGEGMPVSEPQAMRTMATTTGVPAAAIVVDEDGVNTLASVRTLRRLADERGWSRFLLVSQDYHLLRIKMFAVRAGLDGFTVPAPERRSLRRWTESTLRELAAVIAYGFLPQLST